jgi:hypothetical protein
MVSVCEKANRLASVRVLEEAKDTLWTLRNLAQA